MKYHKLSILIWCLCPSIIFSQHQNPPVLIQDKIHSYQDGIKESIKTKKPLFVYIGCLPTHLIKDVVVARHLYLDGYPAQCIIVAYPRDNWVSCHQILPLFSSKAELTNAIVTIPRIEVGQQAGPFQGCST